MLTEVKIYTCNDCLRSFRWANKDNSVEPTACPYCDFNKYWKGQHWFLGSAWSVKAGEDDRE